MMRIGCAVFCACAAQPKKTKLANRARVKMWFMRNSLSNLIRPEPRHLAGGMLNKRSALVWKNFIFTSSDMFMASRMRTSSTAY
jgi:hypothetical protein